MSVLWLVTPAAPEDFNSDGVVDGDDLGVWTEKFGSSATSPQPGDADRDGDVDGYDFLRWQRALTVPAPLAANVAAGYFVPESAASTPFLIGMVLFAWQTRKRG